MVEVVIGEGGTVESAAMVVPVTASYDKMVMSAATKWFYVPAMMDGKPVKFRKRIQITVTPRQAWGFARQKPNAQSPNAQRPTPN